MAECCCNVAAKQEENGDIRCPECGEKGTRVGIITLKSILLPEALAKLDPRSNYRMCINKKCDIVYFNAHGRSYKTNELKVPVFHKTDDGNCPVCYCFGWTRERIRKEIEEIGKSTAVSTISQHIEAGRCGCEVNNPQGTCCLGNVKKVVSMYPVG